MMLAEINTGLYVWMDKVVGFEIMEVMGEDLEYQTPDIEQDATYFCIVFYSGINVSVETDEGTERHRGGFESKPFGTREEAKKFLFSLLSREIILKEL